MNLFLFLLPGLLAATAPVLAQSAAPPPLPVDSVSRAITYQAVVPVTGASKQELYHRAREWFVDNFKVYREVVGVEDTVAGEITGTYHSIQDNYFLLTYTPYEYWRTLKVYVKNGRYRYELTNFGVRDVRSGTGIYRLDPAKPADVRRYGAEVDRQAQHDIASLLLAMTAPTGLGKKQDW